MEIWNILFYPLAIITGGFEGILLTAATYYIICRFIKKETIDLPSILRLIISARLIIILSPLLSAFSHDKSKSSSKAEVPSLPINVAAQLSSPVQQIKENVPNRTIKELPKKPPLESTVFNKELEVFIANLLNEFECNINKAKRFSGSNLIPLETKTWDTSQYLIISFPGKLREELDGVYDSIKVLNSLVWFAVEFQRWSPPMGEQYTNLLNIIADKLKELTRNPLLTSFHENSDYQDTVTSNPVIAATL